MPARVRENVNLEGLVGLARSHSRNFELNREWLLTWHVNVAYHISPVAETETCLCPHRSCRRPATATMPYGLTIGTDRATALQVCLLVLLRLSRY